MSKPTVLYNGSCPVCRAEIEHYQKLDRATGRLAWRDISQPGRPQVCEVGPEALRRRLHVVDADGRLLAGVPAFARIWRELPRYRWLARLVEQPVVGPLAARLYEPLAAGLYAWDRRRRRRLATEAG
jgi:predicted DCC family thiol-disulfide oxidoreductase YuxK